MAFPVKAELNASGKKVKYKHQVNYAYALGKAKHTVVLLFQRTNTVINRVIREFQLLMLKTTEPIRPGRKFPRNHKATEKLFYINYKPLYQVNDIDYSLTYLTSSHRMILYSNLIE